MARLLTAPKDPDAVGLAVLALRHFVNPVAAPTPFEVSVSASLSSLNIPMATAAQMLANFDRIRPSVRTRYLGGAYDPTSRPAQAIARRDPNAVTAAHVVVPHVTLRNRFTAPPLVGDQVLAPIDYRITYEGLYCIDETGPDWLASDEAYVITSAVHITRSGANIVRTERHPFAGSQNQQNAYSDVDSEEVRIGPRAACWTGAVANVSAGMSLTTMVLDHDKGDPNAYRDEVDTAVKLAIAIATYLYPPAGAILALIEASGLITDFFNWLLGTGDDEVGTSTLVLEMSDLEDYARSRETNYTRPGRAPTGLNYHFLGTVNDNDYAVAYRVLRNPVAPPWPQGPIE